MKTTRHLRLRLRLIEGALALLLAALSTAAVATHQLLLDVTNRPTGDVSFSGSHWIGTLDAARLPVSLRIDPAANAAYESGGFIDTSNDGGGISTGFAGGPINTSSTGGGINTAQGGGSVETAFSGGSISTTYGGGSIQTNGYGSPGDNGVSGPVGSIYMDQEPSGSSGHVLWVMESSGWIGK